MPPWLVMTSMILMLALSFPHPAFAANPTDVVTLQQTSRCTYCDLRNAYFLAADLKYKYVLGSDLRHANLKWANLLYANLSRTNLQEADLRFANLRNSQLLLADLRHANLHGADLTEADLSSAFVDDRELQDAYLCNTLMPEGNRSWRNCPDRAPKPLPDLPPIFNSMDH